MSERVVAQQDQPVHMVHTVDRPTHAPCCAVHQVPLDCDTYRRTHVVEAGRPCCGTWARTQPEGGWVPRGCPAGFSSECPNWTATDPCRCLLATLDTANGIATRSCECENLDCPHGDAPCPNSVDQNEFKLILIGPRVCRACIDQMRSEYPGYVEPQ